ncbi:hypothetical protein D6827_01315 [Candidatus Parcubacteria bacterium]|nr:MAG: hypothetical protein D6827_01315 [Candidatus Parcubacteria bacterium]
MRTNASGWGAGSYDFAEMFPSPDSLSAGEVVIFANHNESVKRSTGLTYDDKIAGVISTQPGFLAGENKTGYVPVALAGRVPTYVSGENGDIAIGDPLTTSSKPGYAMKATEAGQIVGYAMEPFSGSGTGVIVAFIRPSYYDGQGQEEEFLTNNVVSKLSNVKKLDLSGIVNLNGGSLISTAKIEGIGKRWAIKENGDLTTKGEITQIVKSYQGDDVALSTALTIDKTVELIGTVEMKKGYARVKFEDFDERFNDVIANSVPYKVFLTADAPTDILYATDRTNEGFVIKERNGKSNANIDWRVVAYRKDYKPDWIDEQKGAQVNNVDEGSVNDTENSDKSSDNEMNEDVVNNIDQDNDVALDPDVENSAGNNANEAVDGDSDNSVESTTDNVDLSDDEIDIIDNNLKDLTDTENTNIVDDQEQNNNESDNHDAIVNEEASEPEADSGQDNLVNAEKSDESHDTAKDQNVITKDTDEETVIDTGVINSLEDDNSAAIQSENIIDSSSESN